MEQVEGIVEVQRLAWNMEDIGIVPTFETRAVADAGFVYIAIDQTDTVIGFIYGYHHFPDVHYSHMMAVIPEWQGKGVGYNLKNYHRDQALQSEHHISKIQWTVDPLLPNNAYLNFAKLGCYCDIYKVNYYGDPDSDGVEIYAGLPTDRFKVTWPIHSARVEARMNNYTQNRITQEELLQRSPAINEIRDDSYVKISDIPDTSFTVQVPANFQHIRRKRIAVAQKWRLAFREICQNAFAMGHKVIDYHSFISDDTSRKNYYEFSKLINNSQE